MGGPAGIVASKGNEVYKTLDNNVNPKWMKDPGLRRLNFGIATMFASSAANGYDGSLINGLLAIPYFNSNIGDVNVNVLGLALAGISLGGLPSFIPASYVSDFFGRRVTVAIGSSIMLAAAIIQCATSGPYAFLGTRIMLGVGLGFSQTAAPPLTTEIAHPKHRGNITNLFQSIWFWGAIVSACVTLGTLFLSSSWSWRIPCLLQGLFPLIQLLGLLIVPESPRWLVSKNRHHEALQILARYHANGNQDDELVQFEYQEICRAIEVEKDAAKSTDWSTFFATKGNRHRLLICVLVGFMIQWAGNGIVSYYLAPILTSVGITSSVTQAGINLALQFWNAGLAFTGALAAERYGRRPLWLLSASGMLVSFIIVTALSATFAEYGIKAAGAATVAFLFLFFGFYDIAFTPLSIAYPVEILPFRLRAKGLSVNLTTVFGAGFFNQYVNPIALEAIAWKFYIVYIVLLAAMVPTIWFLFPETKGRTLEEIAIVFDGERAQSDAFRRASVQAYKCDSLKDLKAVIEDVTHTEKSES
ncbi:general substrate transporter [Polychaeton citri CBS 116435]|uniref:General substrate transporter n=1 Tax=Polychaeton citri CBS 116435 TaxID=1314669 RepID=A0A9P4Q3J0_9PEZI|nr:general substrate transporter [Polychaeton citri CBS 116435]